MEKRIKIKCGISCVCIIIGIAMIVLSLKLESLSEMQRAYIKGFGTSFSVASLAMLIKNIMALSNANSLKKREIEMTDERNVEISKKSMAITFRISMLVEAFTSLALVIADNDLGIHLGLLIGIQLIIFCISNVIISKKI